MVSRAPRLACLLFIHSLGAKGLRNATKEWKRRQRPLTALKGQCVRKFLDSYFLTHWPEGPIAQAMARFLFRFLLSYLYLDSLEG